VWICHIFLLTLPTGQSRRPIKTLPPFLPFRSPCVLSCVTAPFLADHASAPSLAIETEAIRGILYPLERLASRLSFALLHLHPMADGPAAPETSPPDDSRPASIPSPPALVVDDGMFDIRSVHTFTTQSHTQARTLFHEGRSDDDTL
jgi:hypothetical protein